MDLTCPGCKSPMETVNEADIKVAEPPRVRERAR